ncbi:MAG TPA: RluA family pseudouridine synthase [Thermoanaerobaculia bacterium]|nr:RluA family pseudouridine synthase [Thermoanaerobaculia bacterium]
MGSFQRDLSLDTEELRFEVGRPEHGSRLDSFLGSRLRWCTRERARRWVESARCVVLAGRDPQQAAIGRIRPATRLRWGQSVVVTLDAPAAGGRDDRAPIEVLWEDEHLIAVAKPSGVATHPTRSHLSGSLVERLHRQLAACGRSDRPSPCHRLDLETSGVLLLAKDPVVRAAVGDAFERGEISKRYLALVRGIPEPRAGRIDAPIGVDADSAVPVRRCTSPAGQPAATGWRVLSTGASSALVEVRPATGRQHQIRVHLAAIGHPVLGDRLYLGGDALFLRSLDRELSAAEIAHLGHRRCALHAWRLELIHPAATAPLVLEASLARDLVELSAKLEQLPAALRATRSPGRRPPANDSAR